jgi:hypothetical protein
MARTPRKKEPRYEDLRTAVVEEIERRGRGTQKELAEHLDMDKGNLSRLLAGKLFSWDHMRKAAVWLGLDAPNTILSPQLARFVAAYEQAYGQFDEKARTEMLQGFIEQMQGASRVGQALASPSKRKKTDA